MDQKGLPDYDSVMKRDYANRVQPLTMDQVEAAMMKELHGYHELIDQCIVEFNNKLLSGEFLFLSDRDGATIDFHCILDALPYGKSWLRKEIRSVVALRLSKVGYMCRANSHNDHVLHVTLSASYGKCPNLL